eukprot:g1952.t1
MGGRDQHQTYPLRPHRQRTPSSLTQRLRRDSDAAAEEEEDDDDDDNDDGVEEQDDEDDDEEANDEDEGKDCDDDDGEDDEEQEESDSDSEQRRVMDDNRSCWSNRKPKADSGAKGSVKRDLGRRQDRSAQANAEAWIIHTATTAIANAQEAPQPLQFHLESTNSA